MSDEVLAVVQPSTARRGLGIGTLGLLGVMLIYVALMSPPAEIAWQVFLLVVGVVTVWFAERMRRATALGLELTREGLRTSEGEIIAAMDDIENIDRSMFAFKPSNGFILRLKSGQGGRWMPGLWWQVGRRVGVGGVTSKNQTKAMAEIIAIIVAERKT